MNIIIIGKNIDVTPGLREAVEEKIGKLEKYFTPDTEVHVTLSVEKDRQKIEVTIPVKGSIIRSEQVSNDLYATNSILARVFMPAVPVVWAERASSTAWSSMPNSFLSTIAPALP